MKLIRHIIALIVLVAYGSACYSMAPSQTSALQQEFKQVLNAQNFDRAQEIVEALEGAGARAVALQLRVQLEAAIKNYAVNFGADIGEALTDVRRDLKAQQDQVRKDAVLIEQLGKQLKASQEEGVALQQEFNRIQRDFTADIANRNRIEKELRDSNVTLQNQIATLNREVEDVQREAADRESRLAKQLREVSSQLNDMRLQRDRLQVQLDTKTRTTGITQQELQQQLADLESRTKKEISDLTISHQAALKETLERTTQLQDQLRKASAGEPVLAQENERLIAINANITQQIAQLQKDVLEARTQRNAADQRHAIALQAEEQRRTTAEANLQSAQAQIKQIQQDIIQAQGLVASRDAQITQLNENLKQQLNLVDQAQQNAQARIAQSNQTINELQKEVATLQQNLVLAQQGEPVLASENQRLVAQVNLLNAQLKDKQDRFDSAAQEIERMRKLKNDAVFRRADMDKELKVAQQQLEQLKKTAADNRAQLQATITQLEDQLRALNQQQQKELANLEEQFNKKLSSVTQGNNVEVRKLNDRILNYANKVKELTLQLEEARKAAPAQSNQQLVSVQNQLNQLKAASNELSTLLQERFLPNMAGILPTITEKDQKELQQRYNNLITIISKTQ